MSCVRLQLNTTGGRYGMSGSVRCGAATQRISLDWGTTDKQLIQSITSGRRQRRQELVVEEKESLPQSTPAARHCHGVAWYKLHVKKNKEDIVAENLERQIKELSSIGPDKKKTGRYVSAWVPRKRIRVVTARFKKGIRRMVKYGPLGGEAVFLSCQMDNHVQELIEKHPLVRQFAHLHILEDSVPIPCPSDEMQEMFDWLWIDELRNKESNPLHMDVYDPKLEPVKKDIVFEIDRLTSKRVGEIGREVVIDEEREISDENGPGWKEKMKRIDKTHRRQNKRKEDRTENRIRRGTWNRVNVQREQEKEIEEEDFRVSDWYEGPREEEEDVAPPERQPKQAEDDVVPPERQPKQYEDDVVPPERQPKQYEDDVVPPERQPKQYEDDVVPPERQPKQYEDDVVPPERQSKQYEEDRRDARSFSRFFEENEEPTFQMAESGVTDEEDAPLSIPPEPTEKDDMSILFPRPEKLTKEEKTDIPALPPPTRQDDASLSPPKKEKSLIEIWSDCEKDFDGFMLPIPETLRRGQESKTESRVIPRALDADEELFTLDDMPPSEPRSVETAIDQKMKVGKTVMVLSGPYAEYSGVIRSIIGKKIIVSVDVFGNATVVDFVHDDLKLEE